MPIYPYKCQDCNHEFTIICKMSERQSNPKCEKCGSDNTKGTVGNATFVINGGPWS